MSLLSTKDVKFYIGGKLLRISRVLMEDRAPAGPATVDRIFQQEGDPCPGCTIVS